MLFLLHKLTDAGVFDDFPKIFQNCSERQANVLKNFRRLPKTFGEDPKMFDDTPTKLSTI